MRTKERDHTIMYGLESFYVLSQNLTVIQKAIFGVSNPRIIKYIEDGLIKLKLFQLEKGN